MDRRDHTSQKLDSITADYLRDLYDDCLKEFQINGMPENKTASDSQPKNTITDYHQTKKQTNNKMEDSEDNSVGMQEKGFKDLGPLQPKFSRKKKFSRKPKRKKNSSMQGIEDLMEKRKKSTKRSIARFEEKMKKLRTAPAMSEIKRVLKEDWKTMKKEGTKLNYQKFIGSGIKKILDKRLFVVRTKTITRILRTNL